MLNSTEVIRHIEKNLGFKLTDLELSHDEILQNIRSESLITFSKYFPYQERIRIDSKNDLAEGYNNIFYLNTENEIININRIVSSSLLGANAVYDMLHPYAQNMLHGDPITRQLNMDLVSAVKNPITWSFIPPNKIEIAPSSYVTDNFIIVVNVVHPEHFGTIPTNLREIFLKLCLYDTQIALYNIRNRFSNLQTSFGNIELFIDDLRDAKDKKDELIEKMVNSSIRNPNRKKIWIA